MPINITGAVQQAVHGLVGGKVKTALQGTSSGITTANQSLSILDKYKDPKELAKLSQHFRDLEKDPHSLYNALTAFTADTMPAYAGALGKSMATDDGTEIYDKAGQLATANAVRREGMNREIVGHTQDILRAAKRDAINNVTSLYVANDDRNIVDTLGGKK